MEIACSMIKRWLSARPESSDEVNLRLTNLQRRFRSYKYNIYVLNHSALRIQHWLYKAWSKKSKIRRAKMLEPKLPDSPIYDPQSVATLSLGEEEYLADFPDHGICECGNHIEHLVLKATNMETRNQTGCVGKTEATTAKTNTEKTTEGSTYKSTPQKAKEKSPIKAKRGIYSANRFKKPAETHRDNKENNKNTQKREAIKNVQGIINMHWTKLVGGTKGGFLPGKVGDSSGLKATKVRGRILHPEAKPQRPTNPITELKTAREVTAKPVHLRPQKPLPIRPQSAMRSRSISQCRPQTESKKNTASKTNRQAMLTPCKTKPKSNKKPLNTARVEPQKISEPPKEVKEFEVKEIEKRQRRSREARRKASLVSPPEVQRTSSKERIQPMRGRSISVNNREKNVKLTEKDKRINQVAAKKYLSELYVKTMYKTEDMKKAVKNKLKPVIKQKMSIVEFYQIQEKAAKVIQRAFRRFCNHV